MNQQGNPAHRWLVCLTATLFALLASGPSRSAELKIGLNFTGSSLYEDSERIPPDTMGAVGHEHIVELINGRYSVYRKTDGVRVQTSSLTDFWLAAGVPVREIAFDPRILFDPHSERWFAASVDNPRDDNVFLVAVSLTSDPTEGWSAIAVDTDPSSPCWGDFPTLGMNDEGIFVIVQLVKNNPFFACSRNRMLVVPKQDLLAATPENPVLEAVSSDPTRPNMLWNLRKMGVPFPDSVPETVKPKIDSPRQAPREPGPPRLDTSLPPNVVTVSGFYADFGRSFQPIVDLDNGGLPAAILHLRGGGIGTTREFYRSDVSGEILSPSLVARNQPIPVMRYDSKTKARQPAPKADVDIANGIAFHSNIVRRNGAFWGAHTVLDFATGNRPTIRWFQIDAETNEILQEGLIVMDDMHLYYGSIAVNEGEDVVIGFNGSNESHFISSYAVLGQTENGVTTFGEPILLKAGQAGYEVIRRNDRNRWGDYSATVIDPDDPKVFWTFQEYVSEEDIWSTQITELVVFSDRDDDGIRDEDDACPDSDPGETVVINGCDSRTANRRDDSGCKISDEVAKCAADTWHHGMFVRCVAGLTNELKKAGQLSGREKGAIQSCAARSGHR